MVLAGRDLRRRDLIAGNNCWRRKSCRGLPSRIRASLCSTQDLIYLLQPFLVSSNPSNKRPALAPASVSIRWGWPFSTV